jgi:hypothetical protein
METHMKLPLVLLTLALGAVGAAGAAPADNKKLDARTIVDKVVDADPFGMMDSTLSGRAVLHDKNKDERILEFRMDALRYKPGLSKTITRFSAPADIAGVGFLQVMRDDADDDRFLYLPDLKKSRRISGALRNNSFMGTDFSFADLDMRDLRESKATQTGTEKIGKFEYYKLDVIPTREDTNYSKFELWVRTDNFLVLKWLMYDKSKTLLKTWQASEMKRVDGHWYASKGRIENHREKHTTDMFLDNMKATKIAESEFSVNKLEKL